MNGPQFVCALAAAKWREDGTLTALLGDRPAELGGLLLVALDILCAQAAALGDREVPPVSGEAMLRRWAAGFAAEEAGRS